MNDRLEIASRILAGFTIDSHCIGNTGVSDALQLADKLIAAELESRPVEKTEEDELIDIAELQRKYNNEGHEPIPECKEHHSCMTCNYGIKCPFFEASVCLRITEHRCYWQPKEQTNGES